jgi:hypothetical protein
MHLINSAANYNNLLHISLSKDLNFNNITVQNITNNSPGKFLLNDNLSSNGSTFQCVLASIMGKNRSSYEVQNLKFGLSVVLYLSLKYRKLLATRLRVGNNNFFRKYNN